MAGFIQGDIVITLIGYLSALGAGWLVKHHTAFSTKLIPILTFVVSVLTQIAVALTEAQPVPPVAEPAAYLTAGFFNSAFFTILARAILQALLVTGTHSTVKNLSQGLKEI